MTHRLFSPLLVILLVTLLLAACAFPARRAPANQPHLLEATQAALAVRTEIARPPSTPTTLPTIAPTLAPTVNPVAETAQAAPTRAPLTATPLPGTVFLTLPAAPEYVFQVDSAMWQPDAETGGLVHQTLDGCRIDSVPGGGMGQPERLFWQDWGRFRWEMNDYGSRAMVAPLPGAGVTQPAYLDLSGYNRRACRLAHEEALAGLIAQAEASGSAMFAPFPSPTPRPALEGFDCPDTPPARLRVGDQVSVITDGLWLRTEPRVDVSTRARQFLKYPPYIIRVTAGPVCEEYVFWQVDVIEYGEAGETVQGWLAEGDPEEYYLQPVR